MTQQAATQASSSSKSKWTPEYRREYMRRSKANYVVPDKEKELQRVREWRRKNPFYQRPNEQVGRRDLCWLWYHLYKQDQTHTMGLDEQLILEEDDHV